MLARKASFQQLTQNSLASVPDGSADYALSGPRSRLDYGAKKSINGGDIEVGDIVDTPGGMHGVVKFIGNVRGKHGVFCGVELEGSLSGKGKNDGVVDGVRYFTTSSPMSGMFVPISRATKRLSASSSNAPPTPPLSSHSALTANSTRRSDSPGPRTLGGSLGKPALGRPSLSRPESPIRRQAGGTPRLLPPTTPRHVSAAAGPGPSRLLAPSPTPGKGRGERGRSGSVSINQEPEIRLGTSGGAPRITPVPKQMGAQLGVKKGVHSFGMRSASAMDKRLVDDDVASPIDTDVPEIAMVLRRNEDGGATAALVSELERKLAERERQLDEQTASMNEMESTLIELQSLIESAQHTANSPQMMGLQKNLRDIEDADASQLRALLREKNDKIAQLNQEFDSHRADFRSTIDTLELASSETVRVYEQRVEDLLQQNRELMERGEDVDSVARQLKQLEELVAELEEGLEDARRGEAEARGEVEFLRGEVERSREELRREKEKSAAAVANAAVGSMMRNNNAELEKKDEEIRGLKAIIHSLSRDTVSDDENEPVNAKTTNGQPPLTNGHVNSGSEAQSGERAKEREIREKLEQRIMELEAQVKAKEERESQLEREIELLERDRRNSVISERPAKTNSIYSVASEKAFQELTKPLNRVTIDRNAGGSTVNDTARESKGSLASWMSAHEESKLATTKTPSADGDPNLWCEMCEAGGHDILTCTSMFGSSGGRPAIEGAEAKPDTTVSTPIDTEGDIAPLSVQSSSPIDAPEEFPMSPASTRKKSVHLPPPPPMVDGIFGPTAGKESGIVDDNKWCAVCERDGHDSVDCPFDEDAY
ncbi:hypothetical protein BGX38DRAFT_1087611 [Terfezia claveryi]|nr:hypothetical protein BGX38DRAFT_1087611 [Terfezia claveryi]